MIGSACLGPRKGEAVWSRTLVPGSVLLSLQLLPSLSSHTVLVEPDVQQVPKAETYADPATWAGCQSTFAFL